MKCPDCHNEVDVVIHEATGQKILFVKGNQNSLHNCKPKKYWCYSCGAAIRFDRPCVHKRLEENPGIKSGLDSFS